MDKQIKEQAIQITKTITPEYPLGYTEVYHTVYFYLMECYSLNKSCNRDEIDRRLRSYYTRG